MRGWQIASTAGAVVVVGACTATVVALASSPSHHDHSAATAAPSPTATQVPVLDTLSPASTASAPNTPTTPSTSDASAASTHPAPSPGTTSAHPTRTASRTPSPTPAPRTRSTPAPAPRPTTSKAPAPVRGQALPLGSTTGTATRVITVVASSTSSTTAVLQAWDKAPGGGWLRHGSSVTAHVGSDGLTSSPSESKSATPIGSFTLTQAFGALANPGTPLPYFRTDSADWWISQEGPLYNTHQHCSSGCAFTQGDPNEHLAAITPEYNYAVVIDYNRSPVRQGAGSAFFLHVSDGGPTAGCVSVPQSTLVSLMRWLNPSTHPRILIGVT